jgi:hypothetical protein
MSWVVLGDELGISKQAAAQRYGKSTLLSPVSGSPPTR